MQGPSPTPAPTAKKSNKRAVVSEDDSPALIRVAKNARVHAGLSYKDVVSEHESTIAQLKEQLARSLAAAARQELVLVADNVQPAARTPVADLSANNKANVVRERLQGG